MDGIRLGTWHFEGGYSCLDLTVGTTCGTNVGRHGGRTILALHDAGNSEMVVTVRDSDGNRHTHSLLSGGTLIIEAFGVSEADALQQALLAAGLALRRQRMRNRIERRFRAARADSTPAPGA